LALPDAWDAAALTFQISPDGNTYLDRHHAQQSVTGEWVSYPATILQTVPNSILLLPPDAGLNIGWLKIRSGTKAQPVKQSADRQFTIVCG